MQRTFQKGAVDMLIYPLTEIPSAKNGSRLVNPAIGKSHGLTPPTYPGDEGFDAEFYEIVELRLDVAADNHQAFADFLAKHHPRANYDPYRPLPPLEAMGLSIYDPQELAQSVRMDSPIMYADAILTYLLSTGATLKRPTTDHIDFLGAQVYIRENMGRRATTQHEKSV